jgi:hypothetical protein
MERGKERYMGRMKLKLHGGCRRRKEQGRGEENLFVAREQ